MPTLDEHWEIVQANMDAIKKIIDGMESVPMIRCYSCDTIITNGRYQVGSRDFCSRYCIAERGGEK